MINAVNREIPEYIEGYGPVKPYQGAFATPPSGRIAGGKQAADLPRSEKLLKSIDQALDAVGLREGMSISFHHHFRNGDYVLLMVLEAIARKGIKGLTLFPSSIPDRSAPIIRFLQEGVITAVKTSGVRGPIGHYLTEGHQAVPALIRSHGGRARAIESGDDKVDVAFIGAPTCDIYGNINGIHGKSACGSLGYAKVDAAYAGKVVAITDNLVRHHIYPISIPQSQVDFIVEVDSIGDPTGIATSALRISNDPRELLIAKTTAGVIEHSGYFKDGWSLQLGGGGASLAVARFIRERMIAGKITGSFGLGGIAGVFVQMLEEGLFRMAFDGQTFDQQAIESLRNNSNHIEISAAQYANPHNRGPLVDNLDVVVLGATEVDVDFNVNGVTDSNGILMGASGGQSDTAAGANLTIVVAPLLRSRLPIILDRVHTVVTPGETVDVIVTDQGIAVNPRRKDLLENLQAAGVPLVSIEALRDKAYEIVGRPDPIAVSNKIVGVVEYRDGTVIDVVRKPL